MMVVGHQAGLFDTMAGLPHSTSEEIAAAGDLNERYVREWLGAMVTGLVVEYEPEAKTYWLPPEHGASTTRAAGPDNLLLLMQMVPMMAAVQKPILECFRNGGGVPYEAFTDFHPLMAELSGTMHDALLIDKILPFVPEVVDRLKTGIDVLDVACGSGHAVNLMAREFPQSRFTGYDFSDGCVATGQAEAEAFGLTNAHFATKDVSALGEVDGYDFITTFDTIHDQAQPRAVLKGIADALRPDGTFLMADDASSSKLEENIGHALGPFLYSISTMH
jgi:hypothetical protein